MIGEGGNKGEIDKLRRDLISIVESIGDFSVSLDYVDSDFDKTKSSDYDSVKAESIEAKEHLKREETILEVGNEIATKLEEIPPAKPPRKKVVFTTKDTILNIEADAEIDTKEDAVFTKKRSEVLVKLKKFLSKITQSRKEKVEHEIPVAKVELYKKVENLFNAFNKKIDTFIDKYKKASVEHKKTNAIKNQIKSTNKEITNLMKNFKSVEKQYKELYYKINKAQNYTIHDTGLKVYARQTQHADVEFFRNDKKDLGIYKQLKKLDVYITKLKSDMHNQIDKIKDINIKTTQSVITDETGNQPKPLPRKSILKSTNIEHPKSDITEAQAQHSTTVILEKKHISQKKSLETSASALDNMQKDIQSILKNISKETIEQYEKSPMKEAKKKMKDWVDKISEKAKSGKSEGKDMRSR